MKPEKMIRSILWWMFLGLIVLFILVWVLSGGPRKVWDKASSWTTAFGAPQGESIDETPGGILSIFTRPEAGTWFTLPWQPQMPTGPLTTNPDDYAYEDTVSGGTHSETPLHEIPVRLQHVVWNENPSLEYIELRSQTTTSLNGWTLRNGAGLQLPFPLASRTLNENGLNVQEAVSVVPNDVVIITSGSSPVGTSYKDGGTWRLFIGSPRSLWSLEHDTIQLINARGVVVDSYTY